MQKEIININKDEKMRVCLCTTRDTRGEENLQVLINVRNALMPGRSMIVNMLNRDTFPKICCQMRFMIRTET